MTLAILPFRPEADIREILEVRMILESGAIERLCREGLSTEDHLHLMPEACGQLERLAR